MHCSGSHDVNPASEVGSVPPSVLFDRDAEWRALAGWLERVVAAHGEACVRCGWDATDYYLDEHSQARLAADRSARDDPDERWPDHTGSKVMT